MAGIDMLHVPFKGGGPAMVDVVAGHTKVAFATTITTSPFIRSGKLKGLGVGALKRSTLLPELPTIDEAGVPGYDVSNWIGIVAPAGTPADIVDKLHREIAAVLAFTGGPQAACRPRRGGLADERGGVRRLHGEGNGQMGARREGRPDQTAMIDRIARTNVAQ